MKNYTNIIWGLVLIALGVIIGGNTLDLFDVNLFFDGWWTLFIIIPSFIGLFNEKDFTGNIIFLFIGLTLLLCCQDVLSFDMFWKLLTPAILIIIGLSIIFKGTVNRKISEKIKKLNADNNKEDVYWATFSGQKVIADKEKFKGADMNAIFGSIDFDLRETKIASDVVINACCIFGGIELYMPEDVKVKIKSTSIFGGIDNKKEQTKEKDDSKTIYVNAICLFGGVDIK